MRATARDFCREMRHLFAKHNDSTFRTDGSDIGRQVASATAINSMTMAGGSSLRTLTPLGVGPEDRRAAFASPPTSERSSKPPNSVHSSPSQQHNSPMNSARGSPARHSRRNSSETPQPSVSAPSIGPTSRKCEVCVAASSEQQRLQGLPPPARTKLAHDAGSSPARGSPANDSHVVSKGPPSLMHAPNSGPSSRRCKEIVPASSERHFPSRAKLSAAANAPSVSNTKSTEIPPDALTRFDKHYGNVHSVRDVLQHAQGTKVVQETRHVAYQDIQMECPTQHWPPSQRTEVYVPE